MTDTPATTISDQFARLSALQKLRDHTLSQGERLDAAYRSQAASEQETLSRERQTLELNFVQRREELESQHAMTLAAARQAYELREKQITDEEVAALNAQANLLTARTKETRNARTSGRWERKRTWEKQQKQFAIAIKAGREEFAALREEVVQLHEACESYMQKRGCLELVTPIPDEGETPNVDVSQEPADVRQLLQDTWNELYRLRQIRSALFLDRGFLVLLFIATVLGLFAGTYFLGRTSPGVAGIVAIVGSVSVSFASHWFATRRARNATRQRASVLFHRIDDAFDAVRIARQRDTAAKKTQYESTQKKYEKDLRQLDEGTDATLQALQQNYKTQTAAIEASSDAKRREAEHAWHVETDTVNRRFLPELDALRIRYETQREHLLTTTEENQRRRDESWKSQWQTICRRWNTAHDSLVSDSTELGRRANELFPQLAAQAWATFVPPVEPPPLIPVGGIRLQLDGFPAELSHSRDLANVNQDFMLPAVLALPDRPSLLLKATDEGRDVGAAAVRATMLRMLAAMPPGKLQFTVIDPTGLGQNFSEFMHLADFDEKLIGSRIWTETNHINQKLADLTKHMEDVIQKYLRNEFASIQEYNANAGEVAEPFHVLVVANFPNNFTDDAARRLISIMKSGPRCGVYTLITVDDKMKMPRNFDLADLEAEANTLCWHDGNFYLSIDTDHRWPISLDMPPTEEVTTAAIRALGELSQKAQRVEVPFQTVMPDSEEIWAHDSRHELAVPLGRAGATRLQWMRLGKGTSQHVLISGKTGSGKSTMLHAMITNLALYYSPNEVQFYLIDFKKGVEFKPYATHKLPHARVIAIESEREFGMSVLQKLDHELRRRGDLFRDEGVQTLAAYRAANVIEPMPRLLLIIDEFQEFFVNDDAISQNASLILDRLVRQGRAFGIHVLLGSQTLAGAYSLARSTLGQMAVRIALQCSAADAHLILSEDNEAARLLRRPGEAIYNDANGMFEGNHPFQVVWLGDDQKLEQLKRVRLLADQRDMATEPPVIFEGNAAADIASNVLLRRALQSPPSGDTPLAPRAWLGESIAIKEPPAIVFHRRAGSNVLLVGQHRDTAHQLMAASLFSLAAFAPATANGARRDSTRFVMIHSVGDNTTSEEWGNWAELLPCQCDVSAGRRIAATLDELAAEVKRRQDDDDDTAAAIFLMVADAGQLRELQRSDDDFGFASFGGDEKVSPAKQLAEIIRSGPAVGVHTILWCASYHHVTRCIDRQGMSEFDIRVMMQMSATDSANLMGNADAAKLGAYRALLYHEQSGTCEKFRPYGKLPQAWCAWAAETLRDRSHSESPPHEPN